MISLWTSRQCSISEFNLEIHFHDGVKFSVCRCHISCCTAVLTLQTTIAKLNTPHSCPYSHIRTHACLLTNLLSLWRSIWSPSANSRDWSPWCIWSPTARTYAEVTRQPNWIYCLNCLCLPWGYTNIASNAQSFNSIVNTTTTMRIRPCAIKFCSIIWRTFEQLKKKDISN